MNSHHPRRAHAARLAVATVGVALTAAACGSSTTDAGNGTAEIGGTTLVSAGKLTYCADISAPPMSYYDPAQKPVGAEIELGDAIASKMGLTAEWKNTAFAGIIPALQSKQCDAILSQLYIKPEREKVVDFVPYLYSGNTIVVPKSNPKKIDGLENLCGARVAAQTGTTITTYLDKASADCAAAGQPKVDVRLFGKDSEAFQQLTTGLVDAYGTTVETAAYGIANQSAAELSTSGAAFGKITTGIATAKTETGLRDALTKALGEVRSDGTYDSVLEKWRLQADALPITQAGATGSGSPSPSSTS